ncbi:MAG: hypothetical protein RLZZ93_1568 [Actinomycetota bacterium]
MRRWLTAVLFCAAGVIAPAAVAAPVSADTDALRLISQAFNVTATGSVTMTVQLPPALAAGGTDFSVSITAYRPIVGRDAVTAAIAGELNRSVDTVELDADQVFRTVPGQLQFVVPVEVTTRTRSALQMSKPGLYPVLVEYRTGGDAVAELITFLHPLLVAFVASTRQPVQLDDLGDVVLDDSAIAELTRLADLLAASPVPFTVQVPPVVLSALADTDPALSRRLVAAIGRNDILSAPVLPIDVSSAAAAGRDALYTQWLRDGEDALAAAVDTPSRRTLVLATSPVTTDGATLLRSLGARLLVMPAAVFDALPASPATTADSTGLVGLDVGDGVTLDGVIVDRAVAAALDRAANDPVLTAIQVASDLLAARAAIATGDTGGTGDSGGAGDPSRHGVTIGAADLGVPGIEPFVSIAELLADTPRLVRVTSLDDLSVRADRVEQDGEPLVATLPADADGEVGRLSALADELAVQSVAVASMLPDGDRIAAEWARLTSLLPTSALSDDQVAGIADRIRQQQRGFLEAIEVPVGFSVNLTGRRGTVRVNLRNNSEVPLDVRVRLTSSKLQFPDGEPPVVALQPGVFTEVQFNVVALSNGRLPATLDVFTPEGDTRLAPPVPVTLSLTALSGIGNLVTGAALLVLLTWWVRHIRKGRRQRAAEAATTLTDS